MKSEWYIGKNARGYQVLIIDELPDRVGVEYWNSLSFDFLRGVAHAASGDKKAVGDECGFHVRQGFLQAFPKKNGSEVILRNGLPEVIPEKARSIVLNREDIERFANPTDSQKGFFAKYGLTPPEPLTVEMLRADFAPVEKEELENLLKH